MCEIRCFENKNPYWENNFNLECSLDLLIHICQMDFSTITLGQFHLQFVLTLVILNKDDIPAFNFKPIRLLDPSC